MRKVIGVALMAAVLLSGASPAAAEYAEATRPRIAFTRDFPAEAALKIHQVFDRKEHKFVGGYYLTFWTSLRFSGDTKAVNTFIDELAKCPGVTMHVSFRKFGNEECDWRVGHLAGSGRFQVEINLESSRVKIDDVVIPELKGPALKR